NLIILAISIWIIGWGIDCGITYGIPSDDLANFGHDILNVEFGRIDRTQFGADDILHANLILYLTTIGICVIVYTVALGTIFRRIFTGKQSLKSSWIRKMMPWPFGDCLTNFTPLQSVVTPMKREPTTVRKVEPIAARRVEPPVT
ncbi:hypothetical protein FO519_009653, partial [Halicephalobus sp. NKZ332]